ncbi:hypothetical protein [Umezawaea sp. Da 62-37]|uniref:hypothetical protein n=1 Tax=Umezawaea sp. Da 62-37 TaxID=3075927 RepID=UPI0028F713A5|nr:hypothetical protein [Umezawaea sp. Da 62-37]WNV90338.1 hypothetical protein RM788_19270 [Umezawaea sp. Da 62-37]
MSAGFTHGDLAYVLRFGEDEPEIGQFRFTDDGGYWAFFVDEVIDFPEDVTVLRRATVLPE